MDGKPKKRVASWAKVQRPGDFSSGVLGEWFCFLVFLGDSIVWGIWGHKWFETSKVPVTSHCL